MRMFPKLDRRGPISLNATLLTSLLICVSIFDTVDAGDEATDLTHQMQIEYSRGADVAKLPTVLRVPDCRHAVHS